MAIVEKNEIRKRITTESTYYVLGEQVRADLLVLIEQLKIKKHQPKKFNRYDIQALHYMDNWLKEGRDFNHKQWVKFSRMLGKFGLPENIHDLAFELDWYIGEDLNRHEMWALMEHRRQLQEINQLDEL